MIRPKALAPLRAREFRIQFTASALSSAGSALSPIALAFGVLAATGSVTQLGLVMAASTVPTVVFVLVGGVWADRVPRHLLMVTADVVRCCTQALMGVLLLGGHPALWAMMALQVIYGSASAFFRPAVTGLTASTAPPNHLQSANALLALTSDVANTVGPLVGGVAVVTVGPGWALVADAASFAGSAILLSRLDIPRRTSPTPTGGLVDDLRRGWSEMAARTWLWTSIIAFMGFNLVFGALMVVGPAALLGRPGAPLIWAVTISAMSVGELAGNATALGVSPSRPIMVSRVVELLALPLLIAVGWAAPLPVLIVVAFVAGAAGTFPDAIWLSALQRNIPDEVLSRVTSYDWFGSLLLRPVGFTAGTALAASVGPRNVLLGGAAFLAAVLLGCLLVPGVRQFQTTTSPAAALGPSPATGDPLETRSGPAIG